MQTKHNAITITTTIITISPCLWLQFLSSLGEGFSESEVSKFVQLADPQNSGKVNRMKGE
jgi:hypothetical protein